MQLGRSLTGPQNNPHIKYSFGGIHSPKSEPRRAHKERQREIIIICYSENFHGFKVFWDF